MEKGTPCEESNVNEEVHKLLANDAIREVLYPEWLVN